MKEFIKKNLIFIILLLIVIGVGIYGITYAVRIANGSRTNLNANTAPMAANITFTGGGNGTFTVYGGKVKATGSGVEVPPYYGSCFSGKVKSGTAGIKFYFSDNGTDWDEGTYYGTATAAPQKRYAKAE